MLLRRPYFHLVKAVAQIGIAQFIKADSFRIIRHDGNYGNAFVFIVFGYLYDTVLIGLCCGAMVASKNDHQYR